MNRATVSKLPKSLMSDINPDDPKLTEKVMADVQRRAGRKKRGRAVNVVHAATRLRALYRIASREEGDHSDGLPARAGTETGPITPLGAESLLDSGSDDSEPNSDEEMCELGESKRTLKTLLKQLQDKKLTPKQVEQCLEKMKELVVNADEIQAKLAVKFRRMKCTKVVSVIGKKYLKVDGLKKASVTGDVSIWKLLMHMFHMLVKVSDKDKQTTKDLVKEGLFEAILVILGSEYLQKLEAPVGGIEEETVCWMIELVGNCVSALPPLNSLKQLCQKTLPPYKASKSAAIRTKVEQTIFFTMMKEMETSYIFTASESVMGETLEDASESLSQTDSMVALRKQAEQLQKKALPKVITEAIKEWLKDKKRFNLFNEEGSATSQLLSLFKQVGIYSTASDKFCMDLCEEGIMGALSDVTANSHIRDSHQKNQKVRFVVHMSLKTLHNISMLKSQFKWFSKVNVRKHFYSYISSEDNNIRGLSILILANITQNEECDILVDFCTDDMKMLLAAYKSYEKGSKALATFLAKTNFPSLCVQELKAFLFTGLSQQLFDERVGPVLTAVQIFSDKSPKFVSQLLQADLMPVLQHGIKVPQNEPVVSTVQCVQFELQVMRCFLSLTHHCLRLLESAPLTSPQMWAHLYRFCQAGVPPLLRIPAYLCFAHGYAHGCFTQNGVEVFDPLRMPGVGSSLDEVCDVNQIWKGTNEVEERILGDYLVFNNGACAHVSVLREWVSDWTMKMTQVDGKIIKLAANMWNLSVESKSFAEKICQEGAIQVIRDLLAEKKTSISSASSRELNILKLLMAVAQGCSKHYTNMAAFRETGMVEQLIPFIVSHDIAEGLQARAFIILSFIHKHDPDQIHPHRSFLKIQNTDTNMQMLVARVFLALRNLSEKTTFCDFLASINLPKVATAKLKVLVKSVDQLSEENWLLAQITCMNMWNFTDTSEIFSNGLRDAGCFHLLQEVLRNKHFRDNMAENEQYNELVMSAINILYNSSRFGSNRSCMDQLRLINDLLQYARADVIDHEVTTIALLTIAFLVTDETAHLVRVYSGDGAIKFVLRQLEGALFEDSRRAGGLTVQELLHGLCRIAVTDSNKVILVYDGVLPLLVPTLRSADSQEQLYASQLTWLLAFVRDNRELMRSDHNLLAQLDRLSNSQDHQIAGKAKGALFELRKERGLALPERHGDSNQSYTTGYSPREVIEEYQVPHSAPLLQTQMSGVDGGMPDIAAETWDVMISYQWANKNIFLKLRQALIEEGFKVWMDVDYMSDYLLTAMAQGVENTRLILVGMTKKYQLSSNCRSEAEYARDLRKPILPLKMEKGFKATGWLGILVAGKLYIDFSKAEDETKFAKKTGDLVKEIRNLISADDNGSHDRA